MALRTEKVLYGLCVYTYNDYNILDTLKHDYKVKKYIIF